jgi:hypothetical protein
MVESWLQPRWAQGHGTEFAGDQDDPFANVRSNSKLRIWLYGVVPGHISGIVLSVFRG